MLKINWNNYFSSVWDEKSKNLALEMLDSFVCACNLFHVDYFLIYGSLLGFARNKQIIPWDGDIDLSVNQNFDYTNVRNFLKNKNYNLSYCDTDLVYYQCMRISHVLGKKTFHPYTWPWIDVYYHKNEKNFVKLIGHNKSVFYKTKENNVYPLIEGFFEDIKLNIPKNYTNILDGLYPKWDISYQSCKYTHKTPQQKSRVYTIPFHFLDKLK